MLRFIVVAAMLVGALQYAFGQKQTEIRNQTWLGYFNQTRFTQKSGIWLDLHYRLTGDFVETKSINIARVAYIYYLSDQVLLMAGYAYAMQFSQAADFPNVPEHRPWQQIQWLDKKNGFNLRQSLRIEQRFRRNVNEGHLTDDYNFNWRFRYNLGVTIPLRGRQVIAKTPFVLFNNDLHINAGKSIVNNYFDQNRLFLGLGYQITHRLNAHLGYLNVFQQLPAGNRYVHINAIRLFVYHSLDLRKSEKDQ